jgi:hypothetical protein
LVVVPRSLRLCTLVGKNIKAVGHAVLGNCAMPTAPHFCRVDVDGGKKTVRASIVRLTSDSVPAVALAAEKHGRKARRRGRASRS